MIVATGDVEAAFSGTLLALLRNKARGVRLVAQRDVQHLVGCRPFEIQRQVDFADQSRDIMVGNVPAILAQIGSDAVRARLGSKAGGAHRVGMTATTRIADRRHVIDVDAKTQW